MIIRVGVVLTEKVVLGGLSKDACQPEVGRFHSWAVVLLLCWSDRLYETIDD